MAKGKRNEPTQAEPMEEPPKTQGASQEQKFDLATTPKLGPVASTEDAATPKDDDKTAPLRQTEEDNLISKLNNLKSAYAIWELPGREKVELGDEIRKVGIEQLRSER